MAIVEQGFYWPPHLCETALETNWASASAKAFGWSIGISVRLSLISTNRESGNDAANRRPDSIGITLSSAAQATSTGLVKPLNRSLAASSCCLPRRVSPAYFPADHGESPCSIGRVRATRRTSAPVWGRFDIRPNVAGKPPQRLDPHRLECRQVSAGMCAAIAATRRGARWIVVRRFAGGEDQPSYALVPVFRDEQLRAAPVVEHQCHAFELEPIQELDQQPYLAAQRQIGTRVHRPAMSTHRQCGRMQR